MVQQVPGTAPRRRRDPEGARQALVAAAAALLTERAPNSITGRDIAARAGVNYGLLHHYFAGRDGALVAGMAALRAEFRARHGGDATARFLGAEGHPYLKALVRSQVDYPNVVRPADGFPAGQAIVARLREGLAARGMAPAEVDADAKARTVAAIALQVCYGVFSAALLDTAGVAPGERDAVEARLAHLFDRLMLHEGDPA